MTDPTPAPQTPAPKPSGNMALRYAVDYAGLIAFVVAFFVFHKDLLRATWALVIVAFLALATAFATERRVAPIPLLTGVVALIAGVLTLVFKDPVFVKMKATVVNAILGLAMLVGLALGKDPLKLMLGEAIHLTDAGWRKLTLRYGVFFLVLAALNEAVWRTQTNEVWILFRMPGLPLLAVLFSFTQVPLMLKDAKAREEAQAAAARIAETQGD